MNYYYSIISSALSFVQIFFLLSIILSFYGYLLLKITKIEPNPKYGHPETLVAGAVVVIYISYILFSFVENYLYYHVVIIFTGIIGFVCHVLFFTLKHVLKNKNRLKIILNRIGEHRDLLGSSILALVLSVFLSAIWPSGRMEFWIAVADDYYNWIWTCDYWLGRVDQSVTPLADHFLRQSVDSFGTTTLFGLFSVADQRSALPASPGFMAALAAWSGAAIALLARRIFGLGFWTGLLVALGVIGGPFFGLLIFNGQIGQLAATVFYLVALEGILSPGQEDGWLGPVAKKTLLPVLALMLAYPGGFFAFFGALIITSVARLFFLYHGPQTGPRLARSLWRGAIPMLAVLIFCCLLSPIGGIHLFQRSLATATQTLGWKLPMLNPWLLSGLPVYSPDYLFAESTPEAALFLFLFLVAATALSWAVLRHPGSTRSGHTISAMSATFTMLIIVYLLLYYILDNSYQVWKFASFVILPISFVFSSTIIIFIHIYWTKISKTILGAIVSSLFIFIGIKFYQITPLVHIPTKMYNIISYNSFYTIVSQILNSADNNNSIIFINLRNRVELANLMGFFKTRNYIKPAVIVTNWIFWKSDFYNYFDYILNSDNYLLISDIQYVKLFNNSSKPLDTGNLAVYNSYWINKNGFVAFNGLSDNEEWKWYLPKDFVRMKVGLPEALAGQPVKLTVTFELEEDPGELTGTETERCGRIEFLAFHDGQRTIRVEPASTTVATGVADPSFTARGLLSASIRLRRNTTPGVRPACRYVLKEVDVEAAMDDGPEQPQEPVQDQPQVSG
jgi:hypothetical protein